MRLYKILILLVIFLFNCSYSFAGNYTAVIEDLNSLEISRLEDCHQNILLEPDSPQKLFFLSVTSLLHSIIKNDGASVDSIAEILAQYGLQFGLTIREIDPIYVNGIDQFRISSKSISDFRDFLESWKSHIAYSRSILAEIPDNFVFRIRTLTGIDLEFDYTDVLLYDSVLDVFECGINYFCAHEFNRSPSIFFTALKNISDYNDFMYFRGNGSYYLDQSKQNFISAIQKLKTTLDAYKSEAVPELGVEEFITLSDDAVLALPDIFVKLLDSLNSGQVANLGDEILDLVKPSVLFDGSLPIAKILPKFSDDGFYFSSFGHKINNDATLKGLFPNLTQALWNREVVERARFAPYLFSIGTSNTLSDPNSMISGSFNTTFKLMYDWVFDNCHIVADYSVVNVYRSDSGLYLYVNSVNNEFYYEPPVSYFHLSNPNSVNFIVIFPSCRVEFVINNDGTIKVNTQDIFSNSGFVTVSFSYFSTGMDDTIYKEFTLHPSDTSANSLLISPYQNFNINYSAIIPGINLLILN